MEIVHLWALILAVAAGAVAMIQFVHGAGKTTHVYSEARRYIPATVDETRLRIEIETLMLVHGVPQALQREYETGQRQQKWFMIATGVAVLCAAAFACT